VLHSDIEWYDPCSHISCNISISTYLVLISTIISFREIDRFIRLFWLTEGEVYTVYYGILSSMPHHNRDEIIEHQYHHHIHTTSAFTGCINIMVHTTHHHPLYSVHIIAWLYRSSSVKIIRVCHLWSPSSRSLSIIIWSLCIILCNGQWYIIYLCSNAFIPILPYIISFKHWKILLFYHLDQHLIAIGSQSILVCFR
jgi:hypothetical protein